MKMLTMPLGTGNRFYKYGWSRALNYVAKGYLKKGSAYIDTSYETREAVFNDVILQYEAAFWAARFYDKDPAKKIDF